MANWYNAVDGIRPYMFKIYTPRGEGTGFQVSFAANSGLLGIVTAYHVIAQAYEWEEPIRLRHHESGAQFVVRQGEERVIFPYPTNDLAFIVVALNKLNVATDYKPETTVIESIGEDTRVRQGAELGWCGFPSVARNDLCFFHGHISSWIERGEEQYYLVDGVAINGVSGAPAFTATEKGIGAICGVVTAYAANITPQGALPGVCQVVDPSPYYVGIKALKDVEEAAEKAAEEREEVEEVLAEQRLERGEPQG